MKKITLIAIGLVILFAVFQTLLMNNFNSEVGKIKVKLGSKLILEKDTVMIIDYSIFKNSYTLSNGKEISFDLVENLPIVK